jgi:hypothetical protein
MYYFVYEKPTNESIIISLLFHIAAPTCSGNYVPSSGNLFVASELHANLSFWLIKFCVVCGCVYATHNFINQTPNWHVTQKVQTGSLRMAHSCRNL